MMPMGIAGIASLRNSVTQQPILWQLYSLIEIPFPITVIKQGLPVKEREKHTLGGKKVNLIWEGKK